MVLSEKECNYLIELAQHEPASEITIDLKMQSVEAPGFSAMFDIDPFIKHRLLNGLDDIGMTMAHDDEIGAFEATRPSYKPTLTG